MQTVNIPYELLIKNDLTYGETIVFMRFLAEMQMQRTYIIEISIKEFSTIYSIAPKVFREIVKKLESLGYIKKHKSLNGEGTFYTNEYELLKYRELIER